MNLLPLLAKIDLKTGIAAALVLVAISFAVLERTKRGQAEKARKEAVEDRNEAVRARLEAEAVAIAWQGSYNRCRASLDTVMRIAKEEGEASRKRVSELRREISRIKVTVSEGEYTLKDVVNDAKKWQ